MAKQIHIVSQPHHFIADVKCPYCEEATLGIDNAGGEDRDARYYFACYNAQCISNVKTPAPYEFDTFFKDAKEMQSMGTRALQDEIAGNERVE